MNKSFEYRRVVLLEFEDFETKVLHPQAVVLTYYQSGTSSRMHSLDVGCFCYSSRNSIAGRGLKGTAVEMASFDPDRLPLVQVALDLLRDSSASSAGRKYSELKQFYDWVDALDYKVSFSSSQSMKEAYLKYTAHLLQAINSSNIQADRLSKKVAANYQKMAAVIVGAVAGLSIHHVYALATRIRKSKKVPGGMAQIPSQEEQSRTFAALVNFIDEIHRLVVMNGQLPVVFSSPNDRDFYYYVPAQLTSKGQDVDSVYSSLWKFESFPSFRAFDNISGFSLNSETRAWQKSTIGNIRARLTALLDNRRSDAYKVLANRGMAAGLMSFMAVTGTNLTVALELLLSTEEVIPTTQGNRYSGTKGRAGDKDVFPEFGAFYAPIFKKIKEIRLWVLDGRKSDLVFPYQGSDGLITRTEPSCIKELKKLIAGTLPNTVWVNAREWRKNVGAEYIKLSGGDTVLTSEKLGNTEAVVRSSYARPSFEDTAAELSSFFDQAYSSAIARTRVHSTVGVAVIEDFDHPSNVPTGYCDKPEEALPELAPGFTSLAPTPACGEPVTCLFCNYYGVHADELDVRRLLTLRYLLTISKGSMPNERFIEKNAPLLHRIDEILRDVQGVGRFDSEFISNIRKEVECGKLDPFWEIHFNTFVTVGVVS
ncbi:hypothetical protein [Pseudomonas juntendi]|uniref:hypothetical protein n=2 Tax=Pseudomonas TaxID=286 RepID=UPI0024472676|nr:hypothetical protein [Pseudomonas juntendi]MDH1549759.1 hypothetical protein [Pseudomonas juntendi]